MQKLLYIEEEEQQLLYMENTESLDVKTYVGKWVYIGKGIGVGMAQIAYIESNGQMTARY